jgi:N-acetylneuraminic acid mutarotase
MYKFKKVLLASMAFAGIALTFSLVLSSCSKKSAGTTTLLGNWKIRSEFEGVARSEAVSFVIGDSAYIGTGFDGTNRLSDIWQYDPNLNSWRQKADFPGVARSSAVAFTVNNKGYVGTGYDGVNNLKDFWQYDPVANSWKRVADFGGSARYDAVGFAVLNKGYVSTGYDGNYLKDLWVYDDGADSWTQGISMGGFKRSGAVAFVANNKAYICTGNNNGQTATVNDLWMFDPTATPNWTEKRDISNVSTETYDDGYTGITRTNAVAFVMGNFAYLTTGNNGGVLTSTWQYDIANDLWTSKTAFEGVPREGAVAFSINDSGYVLTGRSSNTPYDDIYQFFPNEAYVAGD